MGKGIIGKLEVEVDIESSGDLFHELFAQKPHQVSNISPDNVHSCEVHEDHEFGKPGSIIKWTYTLDGKKCVTKELVEVIDEENKLIRFKVIEGDLFEEFKSLTFIVQVIPKGPITGVKWTAEFEKFVDDGPYPNKFMDYLIGITKDIEAHHVKAKA